MSSIKKIFVRVKNGTNRWKLRKEVGGRGWGGGEEGHFCILFLLPTHMNPPFTFLSSPIPLTSLSWASPHSLSTRDPICYWSYVQLISKKELEAFRHNRGFFKASIKKKKIADCVVKQRERW